MKILIASATKADKKSLMRFYKQQHYSAGLLGFDNVYLLKYEQEIIGAIILSALKKDNLQLFLHGLVIKQAFRQQTLASQLIQHMLTQHSDTRQSNQQIICFAGEELSNFYYQNGFTQTTEQQLLQPLLKRYLQYKKINKALLVFNYNFNTKTLS
jgi:N-acetylglutamate synthase-like GNAT family acetyltransferase